MATRGRKNILHAHYAEKRERLLEALRVGAYMDTACQHAGISQTAVYDAIQKGEAEDAPKAFAEFAEAINAARSHAEMRAVLNIRADTSWQSDAWFLERTRPEKYGRRTRLEHTGAPEGPAVQVAVKDDHKDAVARAILQGLAAIPMTPPDDSG